MKSIFTSLLLLFPILVAGQGLQFHRDTVPETITTVYTVFAKGSPVFAKQFSVEFEIELYDYHTVGNILRIKDLNPKANGNNYIFAYSYCDEQNSYFKFNIETKENRITDTLANRQLGPGRWWPVKIDFHLEGDSVAVTIAGRRDVTCGLALPTRMKPQIVFGSTTWNT